MKKAFLNLHKFSSDEELIDEIIRIDNDNSAYEKVINEPVFNDNKFPEI